MANTSRGLGSHGLDMDTNPHTTPPYAATVDAIHLLKQFLSSAQVSLAEETKRHFDQASFVRFVANTPVPMPPKFEKGPHFVGSGWTMSVHSGRANLIGVPRLVAVK